MATLNIDAGRCVGCGLCVRSCAEKALQMIDRKAVVDTARCSLCGICVQACRQGAVAIGRELSGTTDLSDHRGIWVFAQQRGGRPLPVALELLGKARELADQRRCELTALLFGDGVTEQAGWLIEAGADRVLVRGGEGLRGGDELQLADLICGLILEKKPEILLFGATGLGRSLAPRVAARVRTGLTADCTELAIDPESGLLCQTRPAFGGNLMATILCPHHRPQMATVRPGVLARPQPQPDRRGTVEILRAKERGDAPLRVLRRVSQEQRNGIAGAQVIVSAGRGIGFKRNMALVRELAELLGGEVGVTRALVDMGWGEYHQQIGQTGCSVAPKLLIACGVSGAVQHMAGLGGAKTVVAINSDPQARIFSAAQYGIVGDCAEILPKLIEQVKKK